MAKKVSILGVMTALGIVLGWLESCVPITLGIPGVKLGIAVSILRVLISCILFGNLAIGIYSLAGSILSLAVMAVLKKKNVFSVAGVSAAGGVAHNFGQILAAWVLMGTAAIFYYLPVLIVSGVIAGVLVGLAGAWLHRHLPMEIS